MKGKTDMPLQRIEGEKIYLRPMTAEDTDNIVRWRNHSRVRKRFICQEPFTREGHLHWFHTKVETGEAIQFIICEKETDRPVGSVYFRDINKEHHRAEYGIFIGEDDAVGRGIGSETCRAACRYGFEQEGWHKITLRLLSDNIAAYKSYEKTGFVQEAYLREEVCIGGEYRDVILMGLLREDFLSGDKGKKEVK